jgi:hypothetical protein
VHYVRKFPFKTLHFPIIIFFNFIILRVRGIGGGKTRLCEEVRRSVNIETSSIAVAITFNNNTSYIKNQEMYIKDPLFFSLNIMLSIIRRTVRVVHSVDIHSIIRRNIGSLEIAGLDEILDLCIEKIGLDEFTDPSSIGNFGTMELDKITDLSSFARYFF